MIHIVLYEPEIPQNAGNIMRTAMATGCRLDMIKPYGFIMDESHLRRAGMDYIGQADIVEHLDWRHFITQAHGSLFYVTRYGHASPDQFDYRAAAAAGDIYLVFGKESTGIPKHILKANLDRCMRLPMMAAARSLNLSNCVAAVTYEVLRQLGYPGLSRDEAIKGPDFLERNDFDANH